MKLYTLNNVSREIARWRTLFHPGHAVQDAPGSPPSGDAAGESRFAPTEWAATDWCETQPAVNIDLHPDDQA